MPNIHETARDNWNVSELWSRKQVNYKHETDKLEIISVAICQEYYKQDIKAGGTDSVGLLHQVLVPSKRSRIPISHRIRFSHLLNTHLQTFLNWFRLLGRSEVANVGDWLNVALLLPILDHSGLVTVGISTVSTAPKMELENSEFCRLNVPLRKSCRLSQAEMLFIGFGVGFLLTNSLLTSSGASGTSRTIEAIICVA